MYFKIIKRTWVITIYNAKEKMNRWFGK